MTWRCMVAYIIVVYAAVVPSTHPVLAVEFVYGLGARGIVADDAYSPLQPHELEGLSHLRA
jgi:hypothetical protein